MAKPQKRKTGYILQPKLNGQRFFLNLGKVKRDAVLAASHVDRLVEAAQSRQPIPPDTYQWALNTPLRSTLVEMGLLQTSTTMTVSKMVMDFHQEYCRDNTHKATQQACWRGIRLAKDYFKQRTVLDLCENGWDDSNFVAFIKEGRAEATWSKAIANLKRLGRWAKEKGYVDVAPFQSFKGGSQTGKRQYVTVEDIRLAIANCGNDSLRIVIALARFGGLRIPSDLRQLTWDRINWERGVMTIFSPKTGKERVVPIFPDLRTELDRQWELHGDKSAFVVTEDGLREPEKNMRNRFRKLLIRTGIQPWPKLFQNMRASCETDFLNIFPIHQATAFIGNSPKVALQHYAILTSQAVDAAAKSNPFAGNTKRQPAATKKKSTKD